MKLDTFKGIEIQVDSDTGKFFTTDPKMEDTDLAGLKKQVTAFVKKRRRVGFDPIPVVVIRDFDEEPVRGNLEGISGTNGCIRLKGYRPGWGHADLVFRADEFPDLLIKMLKEQKAKVRKTEREIRSLGYEIKGRGRMNATEVIKAEAGIRKALVR
jgi:hypothetical protein